MYELITRHFLACVSEDALGKETTVHIDINGEKVILSFHRHQHALDIDSNSSLDFFNSLKLNVVWSVSVLRFWYYNDYLNTGHLND